MGDKAHYGEIKAVELAVVAQDICEYLGKDPKTWQEEVTFWIDKTCIPQEHALMPKCINLIESFIRRCDGMTVLLSWQYFDRLWCVYEWAVFLVHHSVKDVEVCCDMFLRDSTHQQYLDSIRNFSVANSQCHVEADRAILKAKVAEYYNSEEHFEKFAKCSAIAVMMKTLMRVAGRYHEGSDDSVSEWVDLAAVCVLDELVQILKTAEPNEWRSQAQTDAGANAANVGLGASAHKWQVRLSELIDNWFEASVNPYVEKVKTECVRASFMSTSNDE
jgi:hypothetical protein